MNAALCLSLLLDAGVPSPSPSSPPVPTPRVEPANAEEAHTEGMRLYDRGDYAGALRTYERGLAKDPRNETLLYEVAVTRHAQGAFEESRRRAQEGIARGSSVRPRYYVLLGNSLDSLGRNAEAIAALEQGLALTPEHPELVFNLAVALAVKGDWPAARQHAKHDLELRPAHLGGHRLLATVYAEEHLRVPAILAELRFVALAGDSAGAEDAARRLDVLLDLGVTGQDGGGVAVVVDPGADGPEGNFAALEGALSMAAALRLTHKQSQQETRASQIAMLLEVGAAPESRVDPFLARHYIAFLAEAERTGRLATLVGAARVDGDRPSQAERQALAQWARVFQPAAPTARR